MGYDLHFFGDSFTAGDELVDWKYLENYPTYRNFWDWQKLSQRDRPSLEHLDQRTLSLLRMEERKQSYAGILNGVNHGISGCSMQTIARLVIEHLESTNKKCIVFIQPTSIDRWCEHVNNQWMDFNSGHCPTDQTRNYYKFRIANSTISSNLISWYNCVLTLVAYVRSHKNTEDCWLINNGTFNEIESMIEHKETSNEMIKNSMAKFKEKTINFPQVDDMEYPYFCIGGHVNIEAHKKLAERIKKKLQ
jgi:hypothetical protein